MDFSHLKCQLMLSEKKIDTACFVKIFQVSVNEGHNHIMIPSPSKLWSCKYIYDNFNSG